MPDDKKATAPEGAALPTAEAEGGVGDSLDEPMLIEKRQDYMRGAAVIAGTRITVRSIRRFHEDGYSVDEIIAEYPDLTDAEVRAAIEYVGPVVWPMAGPDWRQRKKLGKRESERQKTLALAAADGDIGPALDAIYEQVERDYEDER